jgi:hypothetical protein
MLPGEPPAGSCFRIEPRDEAYYIAWQTSRPRADRWASAAFLTFWLGGWAVGEVLVASILLNFFLGVPLLAGAIGLQGQGWFTVLFLTGWLGFWTFGGIAAMTGLYGLLRPPRPESLTLRLNELIYDPGRLLPTADRVHGAKLSASGSGFPRRSARPRTIAREELGPIWLGREDGRQRLTIDVGAERIEIGPLLREPEREWLAEILRAWAGAGVTELSGLGGSAESPHSSAIQDRSRFSADPPLS